MKKKRLILIVGSSALGAALAVAAVRALRRSWRPRPAYDRYHGGL